MTLSIYVKHTRKPLVLIVSIGIELMFGYFNITEKNLMGLARLRKNMKSCQMKVSLNRLFQKNNPVFKS